MSLKPLIEKSKILVCVGSGGVGKTTTAASLGLAGARAGRRTLVLTIDPAKRLANALGLATLGHDVQAVPADKVSLGGAPVAGTLDAMMLDQKRAFDEIVTRYAKDPESQKRIMSNRIYQQISSTLAGSHEYAAMAKLYEIAGEGKYDLIILDTPPTANALDFLDAPERLTAAIDSSAIQWFTKPYMAAGRFSLKAVGMGAAFVLKRLARFVGSAFLEDMARFFVEFNSILGGFRDRAREVFELLRGADVAFVLVSSADPMSVDEAIYFYDRLIASKMPLGAFVVNRVHTSNRSTIDRETLIAKLTARPELRGYSPDDITQVASDFDRTHKEFQELAETDARQVTRLGERSGQKALIVQVPFFDEDIYDVSGLSQMVKYLAG
ncbi:MAG: adventurous gliding motility protein [Myxococcales bacterium]|nr:adventurous gliding motility protein [Myxococcales bacterium]